MWHGGKAPVSCNVATRAGPRGQCQHLLSEPLRRTGLQTPKADNSLADFVTGFGNRIKSLAETHELLSHNRWHGVSLEEIVRCELRPYATGNAAIGGPRVTLRAEAAQAVAMVLHELATNAGKYGAFSNQDGRLSLRWRRLRNGKQGRLAIEWQEFGGPTVLVPEQSSYGTNVIRELIPFELGGTRTWIFPPMDCAADWKSLLTGSAGPVPRPMLPAVWTQPDPRFARNFATSLPSPRAFSANGMIRRG